MWQHIVYALERVLTAIQRYSGTGTITFSKATPTTTAGSVLAANANRKEAVLINHGEETVFLNTISGVTTANGYPLVTGAAITDNRTVGAWYGITASGTGDLRIMEVV